MNNIQEKLKLIQEGTFENPILESSDEEDEVLREAAYELMILESDFNDTSIELEVVLQEACILLEAGDTKNNTGIMQKLRQALLNMKARTNPQDGLKHLRMVRFHLNAANPDWMVYSTDPFSALVGGIVIAVMTIFKRNAKYKKLSPELAKEYLNEAQEFSKKLDQMIERAEKKADTPRAKAHLVRLQSQKKTLDVIMGRFRNRASV